MSVEEDSNPVNGPPSELYMNGPPSDLYMAVNFPLHILFFWLNSQILDFTG